MLFLLGQTPFFGRAGGSGRPSFLGGMKHRHKHGAQTFHTVVDVSRLAAVLVAGQQQRAIESDAGAVRR